jgi:hypothetical protein
MARGAVFVRGEGPEFLERISMAFGPATAIAVEIALAEGIARDIRARMDKLVDAHPELKSLPTRR